MLEVGFTIIDSWLSPNASHLIWSLSSNTTSGFLAGSNINLQLTQKDVLKVDLQI